LGGRTKKDGDRGGQKCTETMEGELNTATWVGKRETLKTQRKIGHKRRAAGSRKQSRVVILLGGKSARRKKSEEDARGAISRFRQPPPKTGKPLLNRRKRGDQA